MPIIINHLGMTSYEITWSHMTDFVKNADDSVCDEIWTCVHSPVFSLGRKADTSHILNPGNIPVIQSDRGGEVTYHGPGQLVVYPLINLSRRKLYPKSYLFKLEQAVIDTLNNFSIQSCRVPGAPGVYVKDGSYDGPFHGLKKICSIGIRISRGWSYHGLALNISVNKEHFSRIDPCGYKNLKIANMIDFNSSSNLEDVREKLVEEIIFQLKSNE